MTKLKRTKLSASVALLLLAGAAQANVVELTNNGDFETGDLTGWTLFDVVNNGSFTISNVNNGGSFSGNLVASVPSTGGPPSFPVVKQANIGIGTVSPGQSIDISFDLFGSVSGAGGVFFAEFFSELDGGGTSKSEILGGAPLFPNGTWTTYNFTTTAGPDVGGGVTLQLKADCGANPGCTVDAFVDNVSVSVEAPVIPIPAAAWLFGSGLIGLIGIARRKKTA